MNFTTQNTLSLKVNLSKLGLGKNQRFKKMLITAPMNTKNWPATEPETIIVASDTTSI
jgi:hypothetical protein